MKERKDFDAIDFIAEQIYLHACANRRDNLNKDGSPGDPKKVGCPYEELYDSAMDFYRSIAKWHLNQLL